MPEDKKAAVKNEDQKAGEVAAQKKAEKDSLAADKAVYDADVKAAVEANEKIAKEQAKSQDDIR